MKKAVKIPKEGTFLLKELYRNNKVYAIGVAVFFFLFLVFPLRNNSSLSPLFRNWDMFHEAQDEQATYSNTNLIINGNINLRELRMDEVRSNAMLGQLRAYLDVRRTGHEGIYVFESNFLKKILPHYEERQYSPASDSVVFKKYFLSNLSKYLGKQVDSVQVFRESIAFDQYGFAHLKDSTLIVDFKK